MIGGEFVSLLPVHKAGEGDIGSETDVTELVKRILRLIDVVRQRIVVSIGDLVSRRR